MGGRNEMAEVTQCINLRQCQACLVPGSPARVVLVQPILVPHVSLCDLLQSMLAE